ncbi:riboflavin synthase [Neomicrococcus aestuarii]|uniref:Riboflavin synthase n=1 Tax=Neomicrococcus aestuarii TaxID=556325 RepID=A0A7W8X1F4_9MICC|nr:riboflavin synthase [Neomicrococcus aestuarii]MBB5513843.1 riboflavin synthase [Neomicrococcus aestuarii]
MFTGIVSGKGRVEAIHPVDGTDAVVLTLTVPGHADDLGLGGSIAVNGVCLTATSINGDVIDVDVMGETLQLTTVGTLKAGDSVNLERCVPVGGRFDGHVVQGHVDGTGELLEREDEGNWQRLRFSVPADLARFVARKGSIAIDGISLTVTAVSFATEPLQWFEVGVIPTTLRDTVLGDRVEGDRVNLEVDVMAKYAERRASFENLTPAASSSSEATSAKAGN